jgi:threonyl-tRNA synthetase
MSDSAKTEQNSSKKEKKQKKKQKVQFDPSKFPLPDYVEHRIKIWEEVKKANENTNKGEEKPIKVTLPDGSIKEAIAYKTTPLDIALSLSPKLAKESIAAKVDDEVRDLTRPLEKDCRLELLKFDHPLAKKVFWHSSAHILGEALERKYSGAKLCTGPPIEEGGFYYDVAIDDGKSVTEADYNDIENLMAIAIAENQPFERLVIPKDKALEMFKYNKYKVELITQKVPDGGSCTAYRCGPFIDLCKGPHIPNSSLIKAWKVHKNSSSYWKKDAKNDQLQRVYGISFPRKEQLREWEQMIEEAKKRDHRNIGRDQELFFFHQWSPGSAFILPHGTKIYNKLLDFLRREYRKRGFTEVITPNMFNKALWEKSGHWENYKDNMFTFKVDDFDFGLKPMNCPAHCLMFDHRQRSYKELPIRFADFGALHRNELAGALTGLTRVRRFQQDDAHIFCAPEQIKDEIRGALEFMSYVYTIFGFEFTLGLSTRPEKRVGSDAVWDQAEAALADALNTFGKPWKINKGDGAFYGPKIDILVTDALKREHQCATIQLDFNLPERFNLTYRKADDSLGRPVIIHRAIFGSVERFTAILMEHTGGKWPFWISPRQAIVCSVAENFVPYAKEVHQRLWDAGFDVDLDISDKTLPKKVFEAQQAQYNFILVVGKEELDSKTVAIRSRDGKIQPNQSVDALIAEWKKLLEDHK